LGRWIFCKNKIKNLKNQYDYLIVGAGLFGLVTARILTDAGKKCLILDKRNHIGGNCYTEDVAGIKVHKYGPHIFHTDVKEVWEFINKYTTINHFSCRPKLRYKDTIYSFPINLLTVHQIYGTLSPEEAEKKIEEVTAPYKKMYPDPKNAYEWGMQLVGPELYEIFYEGYLKKQWKKDPKDIPAGILKRQVFRLTFEDSYYNHPHQGIPNYNLLFENLSENIEVKLGVDYIENRDEYDSLADTILYTGPIDRFYDYEFGPLEYRSLKFKEERLDIKDYQGTFMMSYPESKYDFTRIIEHKHFEFGTQPFTVITKEYPEDWKIGKEAYYPVNDDKNQEIYEKYYQLTKKENSVLFGGRMGSYKYLNMDETINLALQLSKKLTNEP
jgi:UDP-galactopyranose mutase